jgi:hypothetical protein
MLNLRGSGTTQCSLRRTRVRRAWPESLDRRGINTCRSCRGAPTQSVELRETDVASSVLEKRAGSDYWRTAPVGWSLMSCINSLAVLRMPGEGTCPAPSGPDFPGRGRGRLGNLGGPTLKYCSARAVKASVSGQPSCGYYQRRARRLDPLAALEPPAHSQRRKYLAGPGGWW